MDCVAVSKEFLYNPKKVFSNEYKLDMWRELKKRWLVLGVLASIALAVLAPKIGAPGGPLRAELLSHLPRWHIYYVAGGRWGGVGCAGARQLALGAVHAALVAPALCALLLRALQPADIDARIAEGAIFASVGGPCSWLSLSLSRSHSAASVTALNYAVSLLVAPLAMLFLCGRAAAPPARSVLGTLLSTVAPFALGALRRSPPTANSMRSTPRTAHSAHSTRLSALMLLYAECCALLADAEGSLYVGDVFLTLILELSWVSLSAGAWCAYRRCGLVPTGAPGAATLALCAVPKALDNGWESLPCTTSGLARLPAVFLAPAQALLLAAVAGDSDDGDSDDGDSDDDSGDDDYDSDDCQRLPR